MLEQSATNDEAMETVEIQKPLTVIIAATKTPELHLIVYKETFSSAREVSVVA